MLFFQSEEHLEKWCQETGRPRGEILTIEQIWMLSQRWYHDRANADFTGRTMEEVVHIFRQVGMIKQFWYLPK
jgi:hypothetical protein